MYTYPKLELFPYPALPSHWNYGWDTCDGRNAGKDSLMFHNFLKLFLFSYFTKPSSLLFTGNDSDWSINMLF